MKNSQKFNNQNQNYKVTEEKQKNYFKCFNKLDSIKIKLVVASTVLQKVIIPFSHSL